jgi:hypothetical protein
VKRTLAGAFRLESVTEPLNLPDRPREPSPPGATKQRRSPVRRARRGRARGMRGSRTPAGASRQQRPALALRSLHAARLRPDRSATRRLPSARAS